MRFINICKNARKWTLSLENNPLGSIHSNSEEMALTSRLTPLTLCGGRESALFDLDCVGFQYHVRSLPMPLLCVSLDHA